MPFYTYECSKGHKTELLRAIGDRDALILCEDFSSGETCMAATHRVPAMPLKPYMALADGWSYEDGSGL
jgi:hypothetical protein